VKIPLWLEIGCFAVIFAVINFLSWWLGYYATSSTILLLGLVYLVAAIIPGRRIYLLAAFIYFFLHTFWYNHYENYYEFYQQDEKCKKLGEEKVCILEPARPTRKEVGLLLSLIPPRLECID